LTLPGLLLLGAPRCGTSTLAAWWDAQPQGYTAPSKEVGFFWPHYDRGLDWYRAQFAGAAPGQVTCDASPGYMYFEEALDRIRDDLPQARLVVALRDPVERAWSHWCYQVALGLEARSFARALDVEERDPAARAPGLPFGYVHLSRYLRPLQAVYERFNREQVLVLLAEELRDDPTGTFARLCRHGGIAPGQPGQDRNVGRSPRSPRLQRLLCRLHAPSWPGGVGNRLMLANLHDRALRTLPEQERSRVAALVRPELPALEELLGRELPAEWTRG
jgi:hypothetical protein